MVTGIGVCVPSLSRALPVVRTIALAVGKDFCYAALREQGDMDSQGHFRFERFARYSSEVSHSQVHK
jgi:hypothetical protein